MSEETYRPSEQEREEAYRERVDRERRERAHAMALALVARADTTVTPGIGERAVELVDAVDFYLAFAPGELRAMNEGRERPRSGADYVRFVFRDGRMHGE